MMSAFHPDLTGVFRCAICGHFFRHGAIPLSCTVRHVAGMCCHYGQTGVDPSELFSKDATATVTPTPRPPTPLEATILTDKWLHYASQLRDLAEEIFAERQRIWREGRERGAWL